MITAPKPIPALALAMCQVVISEGLVDWGFAASQTDLSLLVRTDTGEFLRPLHLEEGGRDDRFFQAHPEKGPQPADPASLFLDFEPLLEGKLEVETLDVEVDESRTLVAYAGIMLTHVALLLYGTWTLLGVTEEQ